MKEIVVPKENNTVLSTEFKKLPEDAPIGMIVGGLKIKCLVVFDSDSCYTYQRVDNLNNVGYYLPPVRYKTLTLLFEKESELSETFVLFDSWKEFYLWCAE